MQKSLYLVVIVVLNATSLKAQTPDETAVAEVINRLFTAMNKSDSAMLRTAFAKEVTLANAGRNREGVAVLKRENSIQDFAKQVAAQKPGALNEEIWGLKIQIDGDFAQAWCDYAFYLNDKFNHCGVDAFHLFKTKDGWKIFHLADTRRKEGCNVPEEIKKKHQ
jgi:hypothetical protein